MLLKTQKLDLTGSIAPMIQLALGVLLAAFEYAEATNSDSWDFAVEIQQLQNLGLTISDLRYLVRMRYVHHASEITVLGHDGRQFQGTGDLSFTPRTCFVLTAEGVLLANHCLDTSRHTCKTKTATIRITENPKLAVLTETPTWDANRRELFYDGRIVKHFKRRAANQEAVLAAYQEEGWPLRIDDPLAPHPSQNAKRRLCDTIKCLNHKQSNRLLHFRGDGSGEGIVWELIETLTPVAGRIDRS